MASTEAARAEAFASQADKSREIAAGHVQQALVIARDIRTVRTAIDQQLRAISIPFRWVGSQLELQNALGEWVIGPNLLGPGIVSVAMDGNGHLIFTDRSGAMTDVGKVRPEGDVHGPDGAVDGNFAAFDSETGKLVKDSGKSAADFADKVHSHPVSALSDASNDGRALISAADYAAMRVLLELVKGSAAGNIPVLDGSGKLDTSILPALAITETFVVANQAAMLALTAQTGDVAIRTDLNKSFILSGSPGTLADWKELLTPLDAVLSVAGLTGAISDTALRSALSLVVGTNVQAYNAKLAALAGLTGAANKLPYFTGASAMGVADLSSFVRGILGSVDGPAFQAAIGTFASPYSAGNISSVSSAVAAVDISINAAKKRVRVAFDNVKIAGGGNTLQMQADTGGNTFNVPITRSNILVQASTMTSATETSVTTGASVVASVFGDDSVANCFASGWIEFGQVSGSHMSFMGQCVYKNNTPVVQMGIFAGLIETTSPVTALRFKPSAGTITAGRFVVTNLD